eukprot:833532-Rhodomonas_salina.1
MERDVLNRCRHPNVVRLFCTFQVRLRTRPVFFGTVSAVAPPFLVPCGSVGAPPCWALLRLFRSLLSLFGTVLCSPLFWVPFRSALFCTAPGRLRHAMCGTDIAYGATLAYAMSGTDIAYADPPLWRPLLYLSGSP